MNDLLSCAAAFFIFSLALFNAFEDGWEGQSLINFKDNFAKAVLALEKSLAKAFAALVKQIAAITDAMVDQDINMVEKQ